VFVYEKSCNVITRQYKVDEILYFFKRIFNFALWQYPLLRMIWPRNNKKIIRELEHNKLVKERDEFDQSDDGSSMCSKGYSPSNAKLLDSSDKKRSEVASQERSVSLKGKLSFWLGSLRSRGPSNKVLQEGPEYIYEEIQKIKQGNVVTFEVNRSETQQESSHPDSLRLNSMSSTIHHQYTIQEPDNEYEY